MRPLTDFLMPRHDIGPLSRANRAISARSSGFILHLVGESVADYRAYKMGDRDRAADIIALRLAAALFAKRRKLLLGFHALGDDLQIEAAPAPLLGLRDRLPYRGAFLAGMSVG
ncbi:MULTISPECIES: hypothetical protein [Novosphingobium]|uniref:hypothetical protein n=1 Tax=Novosphingobium TaxID=165696 RepID=UPI00055F29B9|nr:MULTISPECIES: hypothetical protein [Novosphingobium]